MPGSISEGNWDLAGRGSLDQARHLDRLRDAIRQKLPVVVAETPLISGGVQRIRVPVKVLELPHFRSQSPQTPEQGVGQGASQPGDVVARVPRGAGSGNGAGASPPGELPGEHEIEVELDLDTAIAMVFEDLKLPNLENREPPVLERDEWQWVSRRKHGAMSQIAKRATIKEALARTLAQSEPLNFSPDDLRFRAPRMETTPVTQAAIYLLRDISGSMGGERKYLSRVLTFWIVTWLKTQYQQVVVDFWVHDVECQRTDESQFFGLGEGGGTYAGPAYDAIGDHIARTHPPGQWNVYLFHFTDGDIADGVQTAEAARRLYASLRWFGIVQLQPGSGLGHHPSRLATVLADLPDPPYRAVTLHHRADVLSAIKALLQQELAR